MPVRYAVLSEWDGTDRLDLGNLCLQGAGNYRFRLHVRTSADQPQHHLIQAWAAPIAVATTVKTAGQAEQLVTAYQ